MSARGKAATRRPNPKAAHLATGWAARNESYINGLLIKDRFSDGPARHAKSRTRLRDKRGKSELKKGDI